jgi:hypothetical protein
MAGVISSFREYLVSLGPVNTFLYALSRVIESGTRFRCRLFKYYFVAQPVPPDLTSTPFRKSSTQIYFASPGMAIIDKFPRPPEVIARRFKDGAVCIVAEQAGKLVGFLWIKSGSYDEDEVRCTYVLEPPEKLVWDFDVYIAPEFRFSRAFAQLWAAAHCFLRERGCQWSISRISAFNANSLDSHKRLGIVRLATGVFAKIGPIQLAAFSCSPYLDLAVSRTSAPRVVFHAPTHKLDR